MKIIFLSGYAGSGKDEAAAIFQTQGFKRYAFADEVKLYSSNAHGFDYSLTQTQPGKSTVVKSTSTHATKSVRQFLIDDSAQKKAENSDPAFWARLLAQQIIKDNTTDIVISDWRYTAEIDHFKVTFPEAKIVTVVIQRQCVKPINDPSEHELDFYVFDHGITNNGTLENYRETCMALFKKLF
jgi:dephospho-CoA kinase